jgi:hypothetical protein
MALNPKSLASGQIGLAEATLYTCPVLSRVVVKQVVCYNGHASAVTVTLKLKRSGETARRLAVVSLDAGDHLILGSMEMGQTDEITGLTTVASVVDFIVTGYEEAIK